MTDLRKSERVDGLRKLVAMATGAWSDPGRRPVEEPFGTCDWGECDEHAVDYRWVEDLGGWLPVCEEHRA